MADNGDRLTRPDREGNVFDDAVVALVGEAHRAELSPRRRGNLRSSTAAAVGRNVGALSRCGQWNGLSHGSRFSHGSWFSRISNAHRSIQQLENPLRAGHRGLKDVVLVAQVLNRTKEALRVLDKRDRRADRHRAVEAQAAAEI